MADSNPLDVTQDQQRNVFPQVEAAPADHPERVGRYRIVKVLGKGGFGLVYLAHDEQLDRRVAVKVPHAKLISGPEDAEAYLTEARTVANLDHAHIVPVFDVGSTEDCSCYVVSKYIEGADLSTKLKKQRLNYREAAELVATVADALDYAHKQGLVHRDVKPGNILIGSDGKPYVVDFGLALREENIGKGPNYVGTPAYMSPEQARGEGHRVDGRSDIFSLGVTFYKVLAGRQPFRGHTRAELLEQVTSSEPRPLRQYDEKLPKELQRICRKAMAKRASERYSSAHDLAEDLRHFLVEQKIIESGASPGGIVSVASGTVASPVASTSVGSIATPSASIGLGSTDRHPIKIVPKGLRSFDAHDADFFLELLPGPRDRDGLPDSLRFWKTRIEETDADNTFSVGLIYGPSGCGKSSLVKAGLLPRLSEDVIAVYVEATPDETETRLLHGLRKRCRALEDNLNLKETLAALRRGQGIPVGKKVLIVLDQFEQWLHAQKEEENTELVQALRQCDGGRVQCVVMVRDDFWLAATRFMGELEVELLQGRNTALVDLFDLDHARKVLAAFGRAYGRIPENISETSKEQKDFLKQSVAGLAEEGKVICVRLALFAEMMKGKPWTPTLFKDVGGAEGVGVTFLEETFSSQSANPKVRLHSKAARAVLKALLPESGTDIKGQMKSHDELLEVSGYSRRPKDFDDLVKILDTEIRLITPTDPEGVDSDDDSVSHVRAGQRYYHLTHDYLVHSLRDWLNRQQKETRRGRAELRLAERSALWNAKPENRRLPSCWEYGNIRIFTDQKNWTQPQRKMMARAGGIHGFRWGSTLLVALVIGITIQQMVAAARHRHLTQQVRTTVSSLNTSRGIILPPLKNLDDFPRDMVLAELRKQFAAADETRQLPLAYALAHFDDVRIECLISQVKDASPYEVANFLVALDRSRAEAAAALENAAGTAASEQNWRLKSRLAMLSLYLKAPALAQQMCQLRPDPIQRTLFIEECSTWHEDLSKLAQLVADSDDGPFRSGIILAVGSAPLADLSPSEIQAWEPLLSNWYASQPDTLTHSAAGWALRKWGVDLVDEPTSLTKVDLPEKTQQRLSALAATVQQINQQIVEAETGLRAAWEKEMRSKPPVVLETLKEGLIVHFPLNEETENEVFNAATGHSGGTYIGAGAADWVDGVIDKGLLFDGEGSHIDCGQIFQPEKNEPISYGCWFRTASSKSQALIAKVDTALDSLGFDLVLKSGRVEVNFRHSLASNELKVIVPVTLHDDAWHHLFVTYDGSSKGDGVRIFVDGQPTKTRIEQDQLTGSIQCSVPLCIGKRSGEREFQGIVDEVRIYNRRLSETEVRRIFESTLESLVRIPAVRRSPGQQQFLARYYRSNDEPLKALREKSDTAAAELAKVERESWLAHWEKDWRVNSVGMTMLKIPAGSFVRKDSAADAIEQQVTLTRSFLLADREVTRAQFQRFMDDPSCLAAEKPKDWMGANTKYSPSEQHPVQQVSWCDVVLFCNWLSRQEGLTPCYERTGRLIPEANGYRLPTEAEWEYACRAGTVTTFSHGDEESLLHRYAVCASSRTELPGSKLPNGWGLFDVHGNVYEWCYDGDGPFGSETTVSDPMGPEAGGSRVMRGGSFHFVAQNARSDYRANLGPADCGYSNGFRVARTYP